MYPQDTEVLLPFSITIDEEWATENGVGWTATIESPSGASFSVENEGNGGCNKYLTFDDASKALFLIFQQASKQAYPKALEPEDLACLWLEVREISDNK
jgi:hypothetical protein